MLQKRRLSAGWFFYTTEVKVKSMRKYVGIMIDYWYLLDFETFRVKKAVFGPKMAPKNTTFFKKIKFFALFWFFVVQEAL